MFINLSLGSQSIHEVALRLPHSGSRGGGSAPHKFGTGLCRLGRVLDLGPM